MTILRNSEPSFMTAEQAARRQGYAARSELELRERLESFCRNRWRDARVVHELVMGEGKTRADVVAIDMNHIAAFEVKGAYDNTTRLMHQVGMFQLCVPEVWIVCAENHGNDARLIRHLLPSVGILVAKGMTKDSFRKNGSDDVTLEIEAEPSRFDPVPEMMLRILWRQEVFSAADRLRISRSSKANREKVVRAMLEACSPKQILEQVCIELRGRDAMWRADAPIRSEAA